jgi:hypothetical protein
MREKKKPYNILVGKPEGSIRMDLGGIGWKGLDWMHLVQDRD